MKKSLLLLVTSFASVLLFGQQKEAAERLVSDGVALQDQGAADSAIALYQKALGLDKDNLVALAEMGYSLLSVDKYDEAVAYCKKALKTHKGDPTLKTVYVSYGNALDGLQKTGKSIDIYNDGIKLFPDYFQLYFNKGISLNKLNKTDEAILCFQQSVTLNPKHAGSHNALGRLLFTKNKIPALLAFCRFLALEPDSRRSPPNLDNIRKIMNSAIKKTGEKSVTISLSADMFDVQKKQQANNFSSAELIVAVSSALDNDSAYKNKPEFENFIRKLEALCASLKENEKDNYGFYWDYYVPYFIEMKDKDLVRTFGYLAFSSSKDKDVTEWLKSHQPEIDAFNKWSDAFSWRIN
ncbi:MAG: tetratricopeptide repeat protein [Puia sp.]